MKRVLILTYYWPPSGGAGVQRWLKFVKHLRRFNWEPVVVTPTNPERPYEDPSLTKDIPADTQIITIHIKEPYTWYKRFTGRQKGETFQHGFLREKKQKSPGLKEKLSVWIRGNIFIPDARVLWVRPTTKFLSKYLQAHPVDLIVSTGPPHSVHLIAKALKRKHKTAWIADFRDPWTGIYYFDKLMLTCITKRIHHRLERSVLNNADHIVVVGNTMKHDFQQITVRPITVITNGYDQEDFEKVSLQRPDKFRMAYTGMFLPDQNPPELWQALSELIQEHEDFGKWFELLLVGKTDQSILQQIHKTGLGEHTHIQDYVPHSDLPYVWEKAAVLLLSINRIPNAAYILTGKVFEYLGSGRPILAICPESGDIAGIIKETKTGIVVPFNQKERLKDSILKLFTDYKHQKSTLHSIAITKYSRLSLTQQMAEVFDEVTTHSNA